MIVTDQEQCTYCNCKSTCQRKQFPYKEANLLCGTNYHCGTKKNPCKNKVMYKFLAIIYYYSDLYFILQQNASYVSISSAGRY